MIAPIDRCPTCEQPTHTSESDDSGRCVSCRASVLTREECWPGTYALGWLAGKALGRPATITEAMDALRLAHRCATIHDHRIYRWGAAHGATGEAYVLDVQWGLCSAGLEGVTS